MSILRSGYGFAGLRDVIVLWFEIRNIHLPSIIHRHIDCFSIMSYRLLVSLSSTSHSQPF